MHIRLRTITITAAITAAAVVLMSACGSDGTNSAGTADVHSYLDYQQDTNLTFDTPDIAAIPFTPGKTRCIPFEQQSDADILIKPVTPFSTIAVTDEQNNTLVSMGQYETPQTLTLDAGQKYHICATLDNTMPAEVYYLHFSKTASTLELTDDCPGCNLQRIELNEIPDANLSDTDLRQARFNGVALENYDMVGAKTDWSYNGTKWKLARDEEFTGNDIAPDPSRWQYAFGNFPQYAWKADGTGNQAYGWGGPDMEFYTDNRSNIRILNNELVITVNKLTAAGKIPSDIHEGFFQCNADGGGIVRNDATNTPSFTNTPVACQCSDTPKTDGGYNNVPCQYDSARINSQNGSFKGRYGKIEARIKYPKGAGTWPAYWMMGAKHNWNIAWNDYQNEGLWPNNGEIDIAEYLGVNPTQMPQLLHSSGNVWPQTRIAGNDHYDAGIDLSQDYHTYGLVWQPNKFVWYIDGKQTTCVSKDADVYSDDGQTPLKCIQINPHAAPYIKNSWPFDQDFYFILNFAISKVYGRGDPANTTFPLSMKIDYIRWYVPQ